MKEWPGIFARRMPSRRPVEQQQLELHFGATFYHSRVWVNGVEPEATTAAIPNIFLISRNFKAGRESYRSRAGQPAHVDQYPRPGNEAEVLEDIWYDWWHIGGIVRDVWLSERRESSFDASESDRTPVTELAQVRDTVYLKTSRAMEGETLGDCANLHTQRHVSGSKTQNIAVPEEQKERRFELALEKPLLWDLDHANCIDQRGRG